MFAGEKSSLLWLSKNGTHENPQCVTGAFKATGLKQAPKSICTDRIIGTRKGTGVGNNVVVEE